MPVKVRLDRMKSLSNVRDSKSRRSSDQASDRLAAINHHRVNRRSSVDHPCSRLWATILPAQSGGEGAAGVRRGRDRGARERCRRPFQVTAFSDVEATMVSRSQASTSASW